MARLGGSIRPIFAERDFAVLMGAQFLAQAADGLAQVAFADRLVLEPEGTPGRILTVFALTLLPYSLISPFLGVFIDRWARRNLLIWSNVARAALLVTAPLWVGTLPGDAGLYAAVLLLLGFGRLFLTTKGAALPVLLHEHHLLRGNAISGGGGMISALGGAVVGVGVAAVAPTEAALVVAGVVYAISALMARTIGNPMAHPRRHLERLWGAAVRIGRELREGLVEIGRRPNARLPLVGIFLVRTSAILMAIATILLIKESFSEDAGRLGSSAIALGAAGVGAFIGALSAPALGRRFNKPQLLIIGFLIAGLAMLVSGAFLSLPMIIAMTLLGGYSGFVAKVAVDAQVQEALPDEYRGRAFALYDILYNVASVAAGAIMFVFDDTGLRVRVIVGGLFVLGLAWLLARAMGRVGLFEDAPSTPVPLQSGS